MLIGSPGAFPRGKEKYQRFKRAMTFFYIVSKFYNEQVAKTNKKLNQVPFLVFPPPKLANSFMHS